MKERELGSARLLPAWFAAGSGEEWEGGVNENAPTLSLVILWLDHRLHAVAVATAPAWEAMGLL